MLGADVSHPPAGDSSQPSVSALCASWDGPLCEYISTSRVQTRRSEAIEHFKDMMMVSVSSFGFAMFILTVCLSISSKASATSGSRGPKTRVRQRSASA